MRRLGPEDIPDSGFLLGLTLVAYIVLQLPLALAAYGPSSAIITSLGATVLLLMTFLWVLLALNGHRSRYRQTLTALLGTSALLSLFSIPFSVWRQATYEVPAASALPSVAIFAIMLWSLAIDGHILSRAMSRPFVIGLLVSIAYFLLHTTVLFELMPDGMPITED